MDTEALVIGAPLESSRTSTDAALSKPDGTNPGGTDAAGKLMREAKIKGGVADESLPLPLPPPPPPQAASSRHAATIFARVLSLLRDKSTSHTPLTVRGWLLGRSAPLLYPNG